MALNALPLPWTMATIQLFAGVPYVALLWLIRFRKTPILSMANILTLAGTAC